MHWHTWHTDIHDMLTHMTRLVYNLARCFKMTRKKTGPDFSSLWRKQRQIFRDTWFQKLKRISLFCICLRPKKLRDSRRLLRESFFNYYAKVSEKLTFLTTWNAHVRVRIRGYKIIVFRNIMFMYTEYMDQNNSEYWNFLRSGTKWMMLR